MKKLALLITMCSGFMMSNAFADGQDTAATLAVSGKVTSPVAQCSVNVDKNAISLQSRDIADLPSPGHPINTDTKDVVTVRIIGDNCPTSGLGFVFTGQQDEFAGLSFANALNDDTAAQGVGVSIYDYSGTPVTPNTSRPLLMSINNSFPFYLSLVKFRDADVKSGSVQTSITLNIVRL